MKNTYYILTSHLKTPQYLLKNLKWRRHSQISDLEMIFIIGVPRSGTTLLQKILEAHSKLFAIHNETAVFSYKNYFSGNFNPFGLEKSLNKSLLLEAKNNVDYFDKCVRYLMNKPENKGQIFVEKTPQHIQRLDTLVKAFPNAKFVHIVRDGRDAFCSAQKHPNVYQGRTLKLFAHYYSKALKRVEKYRDSVITIKYEDLAKSPKDTVVNLMDQLGLNFEIDQLDSMRRTSDPRSKSKQFTKLNDRINDSSIGRQREELGSKEINEFNRIAGKQLMRYDYEI